MPTNTGTKFYDDTMKADEDNWHIFYHSNAIFRQCFRQDWSRYYTHKHYQKFRYDPIKFWIESENRLDYKKYFKKLQTDHQITTDRGGGGAYECCEYKWMNLTRACHIMTKRQQLIIIKCSIKYTVHRFCCRNRYLTYKYVCFIQKLAKRDNSLFWLAL